MLIFLKYKIVNNLYSGLIDKILHSIKWVKCFINEVVFCFSYPHSSAYKVKCLKIKHNLSKQK